MEWKEVRLGDFMQCNPKRTIKKGQMARKITMDLLIPHSKAIRNWNYEQYSGGAKFQNGDTIMARITPCLENGKHAFVSILNEGEIAYGSTEYFVFCGMADVSDNDFVYYLTKTPLFRDTAIKSMVGSSGRQRAQMDVLENLKMFVPKEISDQRRIASILSSLDRKIELNNKINARLEEMAQAIFKNWFVDFEPFKDGKFKESELGRIPEGWKVGCLGDIAEITSGKRPPKKSKDKTKELFIPLIGASDIMGFTSDVLYERPILVIGRVGTHGVVQRFQEKCWPSDNTLVIESSYYNYVYQLLKRIDYSAINRGSTQPLITQTDVKSTNVIIAPEYILKGYESITSTLFRKFSVNITESSRLASLRDTLLPRLMSGEIEVPE